jgi:hypothetical protein
MRRIQGIITKYELNQEDIMRLVGIERAPREYKQIITLEASRGVRGVVSLTITVTEESLG